MLSVLPFMAITRRCWFGCPLGFCPLVSFCEENDALHFQVIHCPTNISVLQSIQQLLLISSPCRNPYLLFHIVYLLIELILFASFCRSPSRHSRQCLVEVSFNWNVHLLWLASIAVTVVHQLNGCVSVAPLQSEVNGWSTTLEDPSILWQHL